MRRGVARVTGKSRSEPIVLPDSPGWPFRCSLDGAREDPTWIDGGMTLARDHHGWEALLLAGSIEGLIDTNSIERNVR
jgi:hypothetical protein